jgi:tetratricopeptide (TPR) repeat protein
MPRLQDIELFKRDLAGLAHEAEVLKRWGEQAQVILPPGPDAARAKTPPPEAEETEEEGLPPDFAALLDELPLEGEGEADRAKPPAMDDELAALLGDAEEGAPEPGAAQADFAEEAPGEAMPDFDFEAAEEAPPETEAFEPEAAEQAEEAPGGEALDFAMPDFEPAAEAAEPPATPVAESMDEAPAFEEEPPAAPAEDFSIPEFDLGAEAPPPAETEAASIEEPSTALESAAEEPARKEPLDEGLSLGGAELGEDAFETFSFEEPAAAFGDEGFGVKTPGTAPGGDLDNEIASLSEEAPVADTFKLDQEWGDFSALSGSGAKESAPRPSAERARGPAPRATDEKFRPVALSEAQVDRLQDSLLSYPLNLRIAIEDILANDRGSEAQQSRLVWGLVEAMPIEEVAVLAGRILKRHIPIPKGREKRTGAALEAEKGTLAYAIVHTFLPVLRIGLLVLAAAAALGYLGWRYVYVPLAADSLYREGYQRIAQDRYPEADSDFEKATAMREFIAWYYRYAEAYTAKRQYILAEKKYSALVAAHPKEKQGILDWARIEREQLKFEEAVQVLKGAPQGARGEAARGKTGLLSWDYLNVEGLTLLGDIYLDWAEEDPAKYEDARRTFAFLIEHFGEQDAFLQRMLQYFIRVDKLAEVLPLKTHFLADPKREGIGAAALAELGGYLLDKGLVDDVREILLTAAKKDPKEPEAHYHLARYFRLTDNRTEERTALDNSVRAFAALPGLGSKRTGMYIDSLIWRARFLVQDKEWLSADTDYATAVKVYEQALELRRVKVDGRFGEAYAGLADVAYWQRDDGPAALALYDKAAANGYSTPDTSYRCGNILYRAGRYAEALERFFQAGSGASASPYLDFAFGSALYARNDLFSAEAYFRRASAAMAKQLAEVTEPAPQERPSEIEILKLYMESENDLGAALYRSAARSGDARRRNQAMAALTHAARLYDQLSQAPSALEGPDPRNLGLLNMNTLLKTGKGEELVVYADIEKDMAFPKRD